MDLLEAAKDRLEQALEGESLSEDRRERAQQCLAYVRFALGECFLRDHEWVRAEDGFNASLRLRGLSEQRSEQAKRYRAYARYARGKEHMRQILSDACACFDRP